MNKIQKNEMTLLKELEIRKVIDVKEAMHFLHVSESTVRRLFLNLEQKGTCVRGQGCIRVLDSGFMNIYTYESASVAGVAKKEIIAEKALHLIESGDVIYLDTGTTLAKLSARIADALRDNILQDLIVFTSSLINLNILKDYTQVHLIGGEYRDNRKDFCGIMAETTIKGICYSKCFIGTDGYCKDIGFMATDFQTARMEQAVIANSGQRYILADSEKFSKRAVVCFAKEHEISAVITDDVEALSFLSDKGMQIV